MDDRRYRYKLLIPLMERDYGKTAEEILDTCRAVAEFAEESTADQIKEFQQRVNINHQVWSRLIILSKDVRLWRYRQNLPASYSALYAVSRMTDDEMHIAIDQLVIHPQSSSHTILAWTKEHRLLPDSVKSRKRLCLDLSSDLSDERYESMLRRLNEIAMEYGASIQDLGSNLQLGNNKSDKLVELQKEIRFRVVEYCATLFYNGLTERERSNLGLETVGDFAHSSVRDFKRIASLAKKNLGIDAEYGEEYVIKFAYEYLMSESKSQRYNYKRRLLQLADNDPTLSPLIEEVLRKYMSSD